MTSTSQLSAEARSAGTMPARTNEDLPTPEAPTIAAIGCSRRRVIT
jgi:hypothetical protein